MRKQGTDGWGRWKRRRRIVEEEKEDGRSREGRREGGKEWKRSAQWSGREGAWGFQKKTAHYFPFKPRTAKTAVSERGPKRS